MYVLHIFHSYYIFKNGFFPKNIKTCSEKVKKRV